MNLLASLRDLMQTGAGNFNTQVQRQRGDFTALADQQRLQANQLAYKMKGREYAVQQASGTPEEVGALNLNENQSRAKILQDQAAATTTLPAKVAQAVGLGDGTQDVTVDDKTLPLLLGTARQRQQDAKSDNELVSKVLPDPKRPGQSMTVWFRKGDLRQGIEGGISGAGKSNAPAGSGVFGGIPGFSEPVPGKPLAQNIQKSLGVIQETKALSARLKQYLTESGRANDNSLQSRVHAWTEWQKYNNGFDTTDPLFQQAGSLSKQLEVLGGSPYAGQTRAIEFVRQAQKHLPDIFTGTPKLAMSKIANLDATLQLMEDALRQEAMSGGMEIPQGQAGAPGPSPGSGTDLLSTLRNKYK